MQRLNYKIVAFYSPITPQEIIHEFSTEEAPQEIILESPTEEVTQEIAYEFPMKEVSKEIIQEQVKEEIACVDKIINVEESLQPQVIHSEPEDIKECNFECPEESVQVAYDKFIFGVEFMIVPSELAADHANKPQVQLSNVLGFSFTYSRFSFKMNLGSSSFQVEEFDA
ncbi:hypothetical protein ACLB2K_026747 [Fragaria x ananassa]